MIQLARLTKRYGDTTVVDDVSLDVSEGELVVLLGESGSGKTTTLKMINRLIEPTHGVVRIDGEDVRELPAYEVRRRVGYVFQRVGLFPHMTVAENVAVTPQLLGWDPTRVRSRVEELLAMVGLEASEFADRFPHQLSGGQLQRVGVARAMAAAPRLMLLDEPFGALDPITRDRLQQSFLEIRAASGVTAVFVTHDMVEALLLADRIGVMRGGRLLQVGSPSELLRSPADPYVREVLATPRRQADAIRSLSGGESS